MLGVGLGSPRALLLAIAVLLLGCSSEQSPSALGSMRGSEPLAWPDVHQLERAAHRAAHIAAVQASAATEYAFAAGPSRRTAHNQAQSWRVEVSPGGVLLTPNGDQQRWSWGVRLVGISRGERAQELPAATLHEPQGNRARLAHGDGIESWYLNGPLGLEHGLVLQERPEGSGALLVDFELRGSLEPELDAGRGEIALRDGSGRSVLRYGALFVQDAHRRPVAARFELAGHLIRLRIDDDRARYPLHIDPLVWVEQLKLTASDGAEDDQFGWAVALSADTALVGAVGDDDGAPHSGAVYAFVRGADTWTEQGELLAGDAVGSEDFGTSVALSGDAALVGAVLAQGAAQNTGAAYVFVRSASAWAEQDKLWASDGSSLDYFGCAVSLAGETALVGAMSDWPLSSQGAAYVFVRSASIWTEQAKLLPSDVVADDSFGHSVALSGDTAIVGAPNPEYAAGDTGAAYVFVRSATVWTEQAKLLPGDVSDGDRLGMAVALEADTALAYCPYASLAGTAAVYVFVRSASIWTEQDKLVPATNAPGNGHGQAVALVGDTVLIGVAQDDFNGSSSGAAYVFVRSASVWTETQQLVASDGLPSDHFGRSVSLTPSTLLVGAPDWGAADLGAAYLSVLALDLGSGCSVGSECHSELCVEGVCCDGLCDGPCDSCVVAGQEGTCTLAAGAAGEPSCAPYLCDGQSVECPEICEGDDDCVPTYYCASGDCTPTKPLGDGCADGAECDSGHCVDQVCCEEACQPVCAACAAALKATGPDGTCGPVSADTDPYDGCPSNSDLPSSCGADGMCDGQGSCRIHAPAGTPCDAHGCDGPLLVSSVCDDAGQCVAAATEDCSPYVCVEPGQCLQGCTSSADCSAGLICDWQSRCVPASAMTAAADGCGCITAGHAESRRGPLGWALLGLLLLLGVARPVRRRSRRRWRGHHEDLVPRETT